MPKVVRFENSCYHCAIEHKQIHNYTQTKANGLWTDQQLIPLYSDREDIGYCLFILEVDEAINRERMSAVSIRTAEAVLKAAITLLGTNDLRERVGTVLTDVLEISEAFQVRLMLIDHENKRAINYCDRGVISLDEGYTVPEDPDKGQISYPLICSWEKCLGEQNNLTVTTAEDMDALDAQLEGLGARTTAKIGLADALARQKDYDGALKTLEGLLAATPNGATMQQAVVYNALGRVYADAGRAEEAVVAYLHVDLLYPAARAERVKALKALVPLWEKLGRRDRARETRQLLQERFNVDWD